jgi:hypothetical protein
MTQDPRLIRPPQYPSGQNPPGQNPPGRPPNAPPPSERSAPGLYPTGQPPTDLYSGDQPAQTAFGLTTTGHPPLAAGDDEKKSALDISVPKIAGGALAAMTTAVAASFLGVSGTITGAAFGSIVSSVAAAVYATSLTHAGKKIKTTRSVVLRSSSGGGVNAAVIDPADPTSVPPSLTGRTVELPGETQALPTGYRRQPSGTPPWTPGSLTKEPARTRRIRWKPITVMAVFTFLIALAGISISELALGHPLGNDKGSGTSIGTVVHDEAPAPTKSSRSTGSSSSSATTDSTSPTDSASTTTDTGQPTGTDTGQATAGPSDTTATPGPSGPTDTAQPTGSAGIGAAGPTTGGAGNGN